MNAVQGYESKIGPIVAQGQITNGGPIILVQPENEYSTTLIEPSYMQDVENFYRDAGIVVPFINNDGLNYGNFAPGTGLGAVDIYGHDSYPLGYTCANPYVWQGLANQYFPTDWYAVHLEQSPLTPYAIAEFEGGTLDGWGGVGFDMCNDMLNEEFERVFYKNDYSFGVKIINYYMLYGGTNWGNLGYPGGYTSYDYGSAMKEDRTLTREKYSELKLEANFLKVSKEYLVAIPQNSTNTSYVSTDAITVTPLLTNGTSFWVVRQSNFSSFGSTSYSISLPTSAGNISIPTMGGSLVINGRDSKIMATDYMAGPYGVLYSSAEIFTWQDYGSKTILILYGGPNEMHEIAFGTNSKPEILEGQLAGSKTDGGRTTIRWEVSTTRTILKLEDLYVYLVDRNTAYNYWVLDIGAGRGTVTNATTSVVVSAGYLVRTGAIEGSTLALVGDNNRTTTLEVLGAPDQVRSVSWNGRGLNCQSNGPTTNLVATIEFDMPHLDLPDLSSLDWKTIDNLPELQQSYDDSKWTVCSNTYTNNTTVRNLTTPTSLYSSDYTYNTGSFIYRGHFVASGLETNLTLQTQGGQGYGTTVWINDIFLVSWNGTGSKSDQWTNTSLPALTTGQPYVLTILIDDMGYDESGPIGEDVVSICSNLPVRYVS